MIKIDKDWTLFLDRDGVINYRWKGDYVKKWSDFKFLDGVLDAMKTFAPLFKHIVVVTNQQGVGKGMMTQIELDAIHMQMISEVQQAGGRIDAVFACTKLNTDPDNCRKPKPNMGHWAKEQFPEIDFQKSIMVGDSITDIQFGEAFNMTTVWVRGKEDEYHRLRKLEGNIRIDHRVSGLLELAGLVGSGIG